MAIVPTKGQIAYMEAHIHESTVPQIYAQCIVTGIISIVAVALRVASRHHGKIKLGADDYIMAVALLTYLAYCIGFPLGALWGTGKHIIVVTDPKSLTINYIYIGVFYIVAMAEIKLSILFLYRRIFPTPWFQWAVLVVGLWVVAWGFTNFFGDIFQCFPIEKLWNPSVQGHCISYGKLSFSMGIVNIVNDFVILILPMPLVWRLQLKRNKKILITVTFMGGTVACIVSIVRLHYTHAVNSTFDSSWDDVNVGIVSGVELCIGIIAACIPTYRPLFNKFFRRDMISGASGYGGLSGGHSRKTVTIRTDIDQQVELSRFSVGSRRNNLGTTAWTHSSLDEDEERLYQENHKSGN